MTPEFWVGLWDDDLPFARRQWDKNYGGDVGDHLDPAIPAADYEQLMEAAASVKDYVDKHVAHADQRPVAAGATVTFAQIDDAINALGALFRRYYSLFTAADMYLLEPVIHQERASDHASTSVGQGDLSATQRNSARLGACGAIERLRPPEPVKPFTPVRLR